MVIPLKPIIKELGGLFNNEDIPLNHLFSAGDTESTSLVAGLAAAAARRVRFDFDNPAGQDVDAAVAWMNGLGIQSGIGLLGFWTSIL